MPVIKSAKKKLKQDKKREAKNKSLKNLYKDLVKQAHAEKKPALITKAVSYTDRAVKHKIIHKNKAARIKSQLAKLAPATAKKKTSASK